MRSNTPSPEGVDAGRRRPSVPEGVDDVRRQADARETAAEGSDWLVRGSASEIGREGLGATMATLSRADLDALRLTENDGRETDGSGRAATSAVDDISRQRWWLSVVAQTFLQTDGKELPSWWTPADFTSPSSSVAESDEEVCRAVAGPFEQDGPWVRLATGIGWVRALGECGDGQCSTCRLAAPAVRRTFVDLVVRRTVRQLGVGGASQNRHALPPSPPSPPSPPTPSQLERKAGVARVPNAQRTYEPAPCSPMPDSVTLVPPRTGPVAGLAATMLTGA